MTPAAHWSPADYYRASRQARAAWENTQPQLVIALGETDAGTPFLWGASVSPSAAPVAESIPLGTTPSYGKGSRSTTPNGKELT